MGKAKDYMFKNFFVKYVWKQLFRIGILAILFAVLGYFVETNYHWIFFLPVIIKIMYSQYKHRDLEIVENYARNLPDIQGNFANLGQVVLNIIQNAVQAVMDIKGTVYLDTWFDSEKGQVVFSCKDTGSGIPESIRQDIFKPFFTTKEVGQGTGLGLYICHEIIQKHGGTITLEGTDGQGVVFEVRLPLDG